jgi:hypothetical protein
MTIVGADSKQQLHRLRMVRRFVINYDDWQAQTLVSCIVWYGRHSGEIDNGLLHSDHIIAEKIP